MASGIVMGKARTLASVASGGVAAAGLSQSLVVVAQFVYASITGRVFGSYEFGGFAAALGLFAVLALFMNSGINAYLLMRGSLSRLELWRVRALSLAGGLVSALLLLLLGPLWVRLLNADQGIVHVPLLSGALVLLGLSTPEIALIRRERFLGTDALIAAAAYVLPAAASAWLSVQWRIEWLLSVPVLAAPVVVIASARLARRRPVLTPEESERVSLPRYVTRVSLQSLFTQIATNLPQWLTGFLFGGGAIGDLSRALALSFNPAGSLSSILAKPLQPLWRDVQGLDALANARRDAALVASAIAFPLFAVVGVLAHDIVRVWLGAGWERAAGLVLPVSVFAACHVPLQVLILSCQMRHQFKEVRRAQVTQMLIILLMAVAAAIFDRADVLVWGMAASGVAGLLVLALDLTDTGRSSPIGALLGPFMWALGVAAVAWGAHSIALHQFPGNDFSSALVRLLLGAGAAGAAWMVTMPRQSFVTVLRSRGILLPRFLQLVWRPEEFT